ncbi:MAG: ATP-grasp domain-containing protein [Bacteroides sp.]|nr:ATP-grasp domain-containing protein [Bacteroides sp.]
MELIELCRGKRILVLDGFCKQCLPFLRGFRELGCEVTIVCGSRLDTGYASRLPHHKILTSFDWRTGEGTEDFIRDIAKSGKYDILLPLFDNTCRTVAHLKAELSKYLEVVSNDKDVFDRANDKNEVMRVCMENGLPCPQTLFGVKKPEDVTKKGLAYPIIIKPRKSYGGRGFHPFNNEVELKEYVVANNINLEDYVVQERIPADRMGLACNVYVDRNGEIKSLFTYNCKHMFPEVGGTSTMNVLIDRPDVAASCKQLVKLMNLRGLVGIDVMVDSRDNIGKIIEINVRPPHAVAIGFASGFNIARQIMQDVLKQPVDIYNKVKTDFCMRIGQTDMLWFLTSKDRFRKSPRRMGYKKVKEQMFFWDDPLPWFAFLISGLLGMKKIMREKKQ